jgi:hypothetical protein
MRHGLAVYDDPGEREGHYSGGDADELDRPVSAVPRPQANMVAVLMANDPEAVVLQLVNPSVARWHRRGEHG